MLQEFLNNVQHNLFKPILLFFYAGFLVPILRVKFEFPHVIYQGLTMYLLIAIGWHGGEELAGLSPEMLHQALGFMIVGFVTNTVIGVLAYFVLRTTTGLRQIDAATVAGYYGSDSAGTFVTCVGVLTAAAIPYAAYMPVMLAVMEIPGCLVALYIVSRLRRQGMDKSGNMPTEAGYMGRSKEDKPAYAEVVSGENGHGGRPRELAHAGTGQERHATSVARSQSGSADGATGHEDDETARAIERETEMALEKVEHSEDERNEQVKRPSGFSLELLHEVFLNPGIFLLFIGIVIGFVSQLQGIKVTEAGNSLFITLFQGLLCLFLLEMGMTASKRLRDLKTAGWRFILFGVLAPNVFATIGMCVAHAYSTFLGHPFEIGTYALFAVLCGAASYIAVPAVQRLAIPEASPTLPLAASLGLTFSYNVTVGIPVYIMIATALTRYLPVT
jgi:hypothetical protein